MKVYSNFEQIEQDLKILKLKREISKEEITLGFNRMKSGVSSGFSPITTVTSLLSSILKKAIAAKIVNGLFGFKRVKEVDAENEYKG